MPEGWPGPRAPGQALQTFCTAAAAGIIPITRLSTFAPDGPINLIIQSPSNIKTSVAMSTRAITRQVSVSWEKLCVLLSVNTTTASNAPGVAMDGIASGKMATSCPASTEVLRVKPLSKIIVSAKRNKTIPPAIWNESISIRIASNKYCPR